MGNNAPEVHFPDVFGQTDEEVVQAPALFDIRSFVLVNNEHTCGHMSLRTTRHANCMWQYCLGYNIAALCSWQCCVTDSLLCTHGRGSVRQPSVAANNAHVVMDHAQQSELPLNTQETASVAVSSNCAEFCGKWVFPVEYRYCF